MKSVLVFAAGVLALSPLAQATALNLLGGNPDIYADQVSVSFNHLTGALQATGRAANIVVNGNPSVPLNGTSPIGGTPSWILNAIIGDSAGPNGGILGGASFSVVGEYPTAPATMLMSSNSLVSFGNSNGKLEFIFSHIAANGTLYTGPGQTGIILNTPGQSNLLTSTYSISFTASADTFVIPAPSTALLGLFGCIAATRRRR